MSDWVVRLIEQSGYLGVGFLMFLETIFPPIPSEVIMPVAGVAAAQGKLGFMPVVASGTAGAMLGNIVWYLAARALGIHRLKPVIRDYGRWLTISWPEVQRAQRWFALHGMAFVLLGRLVPTIRSPGLGARRPAQAALPDLLHRLADRHRDLDRIPRRRRLQAAGKCQPGWAVDRPGVERGADRPRRRLFVAAVDPPASEAFGGLIRPGSK